MKVQEITVLKVSLEKVLKDLREGSTRVYMGIRKISIEEEIFQLSLKGQDHISESWDGTEAVL